MLPTYCSYLSCVQILHLMIMDKSLENRKLESVLSEWSDFIPMEGKFSAKKSVDPVNTRILALQKKFEFTPGEPLTPYNFNRFIPAFNYKLMSFNGCKKEDSPQYNEKCMNERNNYKLMSFNGCRKEDSPQYNEKCMNERKEVTYLVCSDHKRRRISTENYGSTIKRIQELKAECITEIPMQQRRILKRFQHDRRIFPSGITKYILSAEIPIKSCSHDIKTQDILLWNGVRSTV